MKLALSAVALGALLIATGSARAQPPGSPPSMHTYAPASETPRSERGPLAAPRNAFELSVGTGYTQGFGNLESGVGLPSVAAPGIGIDLGLGYRIDPRWGVLWSGEYQALNAERADAVRGYTTSLALQYHLAPLQRLDPWVELGGGCRFIAEDVGPGPTQLTYGFQLARLRAGLDLRAGEPVAVGPMVGLDANLFFFHDTPNLPTTISNPRLSTFIFVGMQGRFDVGGSTRGAAPNVSRR